MSFFEQLDDIIRSAVNETMSPPDERKRQKDQSKKIDKLGLRAGDESKSEVDEADEVDEVEEVTLIKSIKTSQLRQFH